MVSATDFSVWLFSVDFWSNGIARPTKMKVEVTQSCLTLCNPIQPMDFSRPEYWSGEPFPCPGNLPNPGIEPRSPALQVDSSLGEPPGKPKNTGVGSLSLLQGILPTQESNLGLLRCRRILYQLNYQGSLIRTELKRICKTPSPS